MQTLHVLPMLRAAAPRRSRHAPLPSTASRDGRASHTLCPFTRQRILPQVRFAHHSWGVGACLCGRHAAVPCCAALCCTVLCCAVLHAARWHPVLCAVLRSAALLSPQMCSCTPPTLCLDWLLQNLQRCLGRSPEPRPAHGLPADQCETQHLFLALQPLRCAAAARNTAAAFGRCKSPCPHVGQC